MTVALQFLLVNDLTIVPRWAMLSLELAMLAPLSIATAWSIGATKKVLHSGVDRDWAR